MAKKLPELATQATIREFRTVADQRPVSTIKQSLRVHRNSHQFATLWGTIECQHKLSMPTQNPHIPSFRGGIDVNLATSRQFPVANGHSCRYTSTSTPAGPLSQDTLSYGGFSFALMLSALALATTGAWA